MPRAAAPPASRADVAPPKVYFKVAAEQLSAGAGWQTYVRDTSDAKAAALRSAAGTTLLLAAVNPTAAPIELPVAVVGGKGLDQRRH